jgi:hypothetical protein
VGAGQHTVEAKWPDRPIVTKRIETVVGAAQEVSFEAPPPSEKPAAPAAQPPPPAASAAPPAKSTSATLDVPPKASGGGWSPAVFWVGTGLTVVAGGLLTWSGLDTLKARDEFEDDPTQKGYDDGVKLERRTNILAGATAVLGVTTIAIGLFATDWGGGEASAQLGPGSVAFSYRGPLP